MNFTTRFIPTLIFLLFTVMLFSQTFQDPRDCGFSCSASDLRIENIFLATDDVGTPYGGNCTLGATEGVYACFTITNTTNSKRSATIFGLSVTSNDVFQEEIITCFPQIMQGKTTYVFCTAINYTCGTDLKIKDGFVGWSPNANGDCPFDGQTCTNGSNYIPPGKCIENITFDITEPLIAVISSNCNGNNTVDFINSSVGGTAPFSYLWNFGDDQTSISENPTHVYANSATYTATLTVTDGDNISQMRTYEVDVSQCNCPENNIMGINTAICKGETLDLSNFVNGTVNGTLNYSVTLSNWSTNNLITPVSSAIFYIRDSSIVTNCVDTAKVLVTVLDTFQTSISQSICQGDSFDFNGQSLTEAGTYRDTLTGINNYDSFIVLTINILDTAQTPIAQTIIEGNSFNFNDQDLTEEGTYRDTLTRANTCDSFIVLTLTVLDTFRTEIEQEICQGDSFNFNDQDLTEAGTYRDTLVASTTSDSFIVLTLTVLDTIQTTITQTIIEGNSFDFNNQDLTAAGTYRDTLTRVNTCDSFIVLTLTVLDTFRTEIEQEICQGDSFNFNDQDLTEAGTYRDTLVASTSADSFIVLTLTVLDTASGTNHKFLTILKKITFFDRKIKWPLQEDKLQHHRYQ